MIMDMQDDDFKARVTFAFLMGNQKSTDSVGIIKGLLPLFAPIFKSQAGAIFDPTGVSNSFSSLYGSKIHPYAISEVTQKFVELGYLVEVSRANNSALYRVASDIKDSPSIEETAITQLFEAFRSFTRCELQRHGDLTVSNDEIDAAFVVRLQSFPMPDQKGLKLKHDGASNTLSLAPMTGDTSLKSLEARKTQWLNAIFSAYILNLKNESTELYELVQRVANGAIVVEAVLNFCNPKAAQSLANTWVFLDTPLLMDLLDLDTPERHVYAKDLLDQLITAKAKLAIFTHSLEEASNNIQAALSAYENRCSHGAIGIRMISNAQFVRRIAATLDNIFAEVKNLGIQIQDAPSSTASLAFISKDVEDQLANQIGDYAHDEARRRDASSIASIVRLRQNNRTIRRDLSLTKYIFITRNSRLSNLSENFLIGQKVYDQSEMPAAITDQSLAAILLLMFGSVATSSLPYHRLLANCTSIPQSDLQVRHRVAQLMSNEDPELSRSFDIWSRTPRGAEILVRKNLGDPNLVTIESIPSRIEEIRIAAGEYAANLVSEEKDKEIQELKQTMSGVESEFKRNLSEAENEKLMYKANLAQSEFDAQARKLLHDSEIADKTNQIEIAEKEARAAKAAAIEIEKQRQLDEHNLVNNLVQKTAEIQRRWDIRLAVLFGALAAILCGLPYVFDKFYPIQAPYSHYLNFFCWIVAGVAALCCFGPMPTKIFQPFIDKKKRQFLATQLDLINKRDLLDQYQIDFGSLVTKKKLV